MEHQPRREKKSVVAMVQMIMTAAILAVTIIIGIYIVTGVTSVQKNMVIIEQELSKVDVATMNRTISALEEAASSLGNLDIDSLNELISSLDTTAKTLQGISDALGGLFNFTK